MGILAELNTDQLIALWGVIVTAIGIIVAAVVAICLHRPPKKKNRAEDESGEFELEARREQLAEHRRRAAAFPLKILIWGPSDDGTPEYVLRCKIRANLRKQGHDASFSEDLSKDKEAVKDPLHDEFLQALSVDIIIMIYGSRGTQTERDTILVYQDIARKAYVLVEEKMWSKIQGSISSGSWNKMAGIARIFRYKGLGELEKRIDEIYAEIEERRQIFYVNALMGKMERNE